MFTLHDILQGNEGKFQLHTTDTPDPALVFRSAHHDSRKIGEGDLFIALKGEYADGHQFIPAAAQAGAYGVLCNQPSTAVAPDFLQIVVPDVITALLATARVRVQRQPETTLIGITGSNGKTGTKEATAAVLSRLAPTLKTFASYNNEIGFPLTLLRMEPQHRYAVLEMGAEWVGELAWLCSIARPHWSIITNVGSAHLKTFGSRERIAIAKSELVQALRPDGIAILNYDDPIVRAMSQKTQASILYYGQAQEAAVRASDIDGEALQGYHFTLHYQEAQVSVQLHLPGVHAITAALAAAAAGCAAGMQLGDIRDALEALTPVEGRSRIRTGPQGSTLIDDTYKANTQAVIANVKMIAESHLPPGGKRWAVLGDMFDLEPYERDEHILVGEALFPSIDYLVAVGNYARFYVEGAINAGMPVEHIHYFPATTSNTTELEAAKRAAAELLKQQLQSVDLVLVKGSHGMHMETLLTML